MAANVLAYHLVAGKLAIIFQLLIFNFKKISSDKNNEH